MESYSVIGKRSPLVDVSAKATGEAKYTDDLALPGMLCGKLLRSPFPHAKILNIDVSKAKRLVGVKGVTTGLDTPRRKYGLLMKESFMDRYPLAIDKVRFVGEEVAAAAAVDEDTALEALDLIRVEYEELPAVFDPEEAMKPGAPSVHEGKSNAVKSLSIEYGDTEIFRSAEYVREDRFATQAIAHCPLEPHGALASVDTSGKVILWSSTQSPFILCRDLAQTLNIPRTKIRVIKPFVGGGFGGKMEMLPLDFCSVLLSMKTGKPVKIVHTREEEFIGTQQRHPIIVRLKTGVKRDGTLVAKECYLIADTGAYLTHGSWVVYLAYVFLTSLYRIPNLSYRGYCVYTNNPVRGAMRGHGNPQIRFADDSQLDLIAKDLGIDPVEIRLKNAIRAGDVTPNRLRFNSCGLTEAIRRCAQVSNWKAERGNLRKNKEGIGIACGNHVSGGKTSEPYDSSSVFVKVEEGGKVIVLSGVSDIGQGLNSVLCQIVAEELGIPLEDVSIVAGDSEITPPDLGSYGSRGTFVAGNACRLAARDAKDQLVKTVAEKLETAAGDLEFKNGRISVKGSPERWMSLHEAVIASQGSVLGKGIYDSNTEVPDRKGRGNISPAYSFGAQVAKVKVDIDTGKIDVLQVIGAHDVGRALNPMSVEGQIEGSIVMGQGQALYEEILIRKGVTLNPSFLEYKVPTSLEAPEIDPLIVETFDPEGPYGAKGMGESTMVPTIPAIANAIDHAIGVRVKELPITPIKIIEMIAEKGSRKDKGE